MMPQYCHDIIITVTQTTQLALKSHRFTQCMIFICKLHLDFEYKYEKYIFVLENDTSYSYILRVIDNVHVFKLKTRRQRPMPVPQKNRRIS